MKNVIFLVLILCFGSVLFAQSTRNIDGLLKHVEVAGGIEVTMLSGKPKVIISSIDCDESLLITNYSNGKLTIEFDKKVKTGWGTNPHAELTVYFDVSLNTISANAASSVTVKDPINTDNIKLNTTSGGQMSATIAAKSVNCNINSGGTLTLSGNANEAKFNASSGSNSNASSLKCKIIEINASSGANLTVWATDHITGTLSSGANIRYKGEPNIDIPQQGFSAGSITKLQ